MVIISTIMVMDGYGKDDHEDYHDGDDYGDHNDHNDQG